MTITLLEAGVAPTKRGSKWRVTVAVPGQGSSGFYGEDVLREYGPTAVPAGTKAWWAHEKRTDSRDMVGVYETGAFWDEAEKALVADLTVFPHWTDVVEAIGPYAEASIRVTGDKDANGVVTRLRADRSNSVDLVGYAGLEGSGLKYQLEQMIESARLEEETDDEGDTQMEKLIEELRELTKAQDARMTAIEAFVEESRAGAKGEADDAAVEAAVVSRLAEAHERFVASKGEIAAANLLPSQVTVLEARAVKGEDITEALAEAKTLAEEARELTTTGDFVAVVLGEQRTDDNSKFVVSGWSN
mgnify:CR=1 FL=1